MSGRREGARDGGRDGRAESGGMAAKKLEPHTEMWGIRLQYQKRKVLFLFLFFVWEVSVLPSVQRCPRSVGTSLVSLMISYSFLEFVIQNQPQNL